MRTISTCVIITTLAVSGICHAQPLGASKDAFDRSVSGEFLKNASGTVTHSSPKSAVLKGVHDKIMATGLLKTQLNGKKYTWNEDTHPRFRRTIWKRVLASGESPTDPEVELASWRKQTPIDPADLVTRANQITAAIKAAGMLTEEDLVPTRTTPSMLLLWDEKNVQEAVVMGHRLLMQRYIAGVPVQGPEGELTMRFDAAGEIIECELPTEEYHVTKGALTTLSGTTTVENLFKRAGFSRVAKVQHDSLTANGQPTSVENVQCGYLDEDLDASTPLARGCVVREISNGVSRLHTLAVAPSDQ